VYAGFTISALFYYSGLLNLFLFIRRDILKKQRSIILAYHSIGDNNPHYEKKPEYVIEPSLLEKQILYLTKKGYQFVLLADLIGYVTSGKFPQGDRFAITFDDGHEDFFKMPCLF